VISQESTSGEENKIRWIIEVKDLYNLHKVDIMCCTYTDRLHF